MKINLPVCVGGPLDGEALHGWANLDRGFDLYGFWTDADGDRKPIVVALGSRSAVIPEDCPEPLGSYIYNRGADACDEFLQWFCE